MSSHQHHRHSSAFSTASAFRTSSRSPSPSASPISPSLASGDQGLSRRHSWNRAREDATTQRSDAPLRPLGSAGSSRAHLGLGSGYDEQDLGIIRTAPPFAHPYPSQASLESGDFSSSQSDLDLPGQRHHDEANDDQRWLSPGPSSLPYSTSHRKPYDETGLPRGSPSRLAASVTRNPTLRSVTRKLRSASVRVVNIMGKDKDEGLSRLPDDDGIDGDSTDDLKRTDSIQMVETPTARPRPEAMPPERLRGTTLGLFGPRSVVRRTMDRLMRHPYVSHGLQIACKTNNAVSQNLSFYSSSSPTLSSCLSKLPTQRTSPDQGTDTSILGRTSQFSVYLGSSPWRCLPALSLLVSFSTPTHQQRHIGSEPLAFYLQ